jgi:GABA(A) receptor-associated protein
MTQSELVGIQSIFNYATQYLENSKTFQNTVALMDRPTPFRREFPFEQRQTEAQRQIIKYPSRVPVILEDDVRGEQIRSPRAKRKFLVPRDMTFGDFIYTVRKKAKLEPHKALFMFINKESRNGESLMQLLPPVTAHISTLYSEHRDPDHFLYLVVCTENTFG